MQMDRWTDGQFDRRTRINRQCWTVGQRNSWSNGQLSNMTDGLLDKMMEREADG